MYNTTNTGGLYEANSSPVTGIYPNPVDENASIHLSLGKEAAVDIRIYNLTGQEIIYLGKEIFPSGSHIREITARDLPSGVYVLRTVISGKAYTHKMVVH